MNSDMVKSEKLGYLRIVYHFTVPLRSFKYCKVLICVCYHDLLGNLADYVVLVKFSFYFYYWYYMLLLRLYLSELIWINFSFTDRAIFIEVFHGYLLNFSFKKLQKTPKFS